LRLQPQQQILPSRRPVRCSSFCLQPLLGRFPALVTLILEMNDEGKQQFVQSLGTHRSETPSARSSHRDQTLA